MHNGTSSIAMPVTCAVWGGAGRPDLDQDTVDCRRRVLGADHPDTLLSASKLADHLRAGEADNEP
jgi:hypothetical protein